MPVLYRLLKDTREESTTKDKWFARAVMVGTADTENLISEIEKICTVSDADVVAVIKALLFVMRQKLLESYRVKLDGLGAFKIGLRSKGADSPAEFIAAKHITGHRVNFQPETHWTAADGNRRHSKLTEGLTVAETPLNTVVKEEPTP